MRLNARTIIATTLMAVAVTSLVLIIWWLLDATALITPPQTTSAAGSTVTATGVLPGYAFLIWALFGALIVAAGAIIIAVRLLYWRKALKGGQTSIIPDQLLSDFARCTEALRELSEKQQRQLKAAESFREEIAKDILELSQELSIFTKALNKKDAEIDRLKRGGDAVVYQRFLSRFLRLSVAFEDEMSDLKATGQDGSMLTALYEILEDALLECGVERLVPIIGSSYSNEFGVADNPKIVSTDDEDKHLRIAEVLRPGFVMKATGAPICLQPAHVSVFIFSNAETPA